MRTESLESEGLWSSVVSEIWVMFGRKLHLRMSALSQPAPEDEKVNAAECDWCREGCWLLEDCSVIGEESRRF